MVSKPPSHAGTTTSMMVQRPRRKQRHKGLGRFRSAVGEASVEWHAEHLQGLSAWQEKPMATLDQHIMSRRGFCLCCVAATTVAASGGWLSPRQAFAEARNIVDLIRDDAAKAPIKVHKLRGDVSILEGSGGNIAVLTGADGKVFIDAGITASRPRILEAANGLSRDPVKHLINIGLRSHGRQSMAECRRG